MVPYLRTRARKLHTQARSNLIELSSIEAYRKYYDKCQTQDDINKPSEATFPC